MIEVPSLWKRACVWWSRTVVIKGLCLGDSRQGLCLRQLHSLAHFSFLCETLRWIIFNHTPQFAVPERGIFIQNIDPFFHKELQNQVAVLSSGIWKMRCYSSKQASTSNFTGYFWTCWKLMALVTGYNFTFLKLVLCHYLMPHSLIKNTKLTFPMDSLTFVLDYAKHKGDNILSTLQRVPAFRIIKSTRRKTEKKQSDE